MTNAEIAASAVDEATRFATASERLRAQLVTIRRLIEDMTELVELDHDLAPEILSASGHLVAGTEALVRAHAFAEARMATWSARLPK